MNEILKSNLLDKGGGNIKLWYIPISDASKHNKTDLWSIAELAMRQILKHHTSGRSKIRNKSK
jgi:hypothetical protein